MAPDPHRPLRDVLVENPREFEFYQAVRLLEMTANGAEPARFRGSYDLGFGASAIRSIDGTGPVPELVTELMSLVGPEGPMPTSLAEDIADRLRAGDEAFARFLDIFQHRLTRLAYEVRKKHRVALATDWPEGTPLARYLLALAGVGISELRERLPGVPDRALLRYAGLLWSQPRSAAGLETLLADYLGAPVKVEQFVGAWRELSRSQWTHLGGAAGRNQVLGEGAICGTRCWDQHAGIRLVVGPMRRAQFESFLPPEDSEGTQKGLRALQSLTRLYCGERIDIEVRLLLERGETSAARLSTAGAAARLGYTSWVQARQAPAGGEPDGQVHFSLPAAG